MRLINQTQWNTKQLRRLMRVCVATARRDYPHNSLWTKLQVKIEWHNTHKKLWVGGYFWLGSVGGS